jgi:hypothetical protein
VTLDAAALDGLFELFAAKLAPLVAARLAEPSAAPRELVPDEPPGLVGGPALDRALGISPATRHRLIRAGLPHEAVGARSHFDVAVCRAWLAARGKKPSALPKRASRNDIDVTGLAARAGIRVS